MPETKLLTDADVRNAKPRDKTYRLRDGGGLYLEVTHAGSRLWKYDFRMPGSRTVQTLSIGAYPAVGLKDARVEHVKAKLSVTQGVNPSKQKAYHKEEQARKEQENALTWRKVCMAWFERKQTDKSSKTRHTDMGRIEAYLLAGGLGEKAFSAITFEDLKGIVRKIEGAGHYDLVRKNN